MGCEEQRRFLVHFIGLAAGSTRKLPDVVMDAIPVLSLPSLLCGSSSTITAIIFVTYHFFWIHVLPGQKQLAEHINQCFVGYFFWSFSCVRQKLDLPGNSYEKNLIMICGSWLQGNTALLCGYTEFEFLYFSFTFRETAKTVMASPGMNSPTLSAYRFQEPP